MGMRLYVATRKGLFILRRTGADWKIETVHFLGDPVSAVLPDARDGMLYAALNLGHFGVKLRRSSNGGAKWQECAVPSFPPKPESSDDPTPWSVQQIWTLEASGEPHGNGLWAGTIPAAVFRSEDGGSSWALMRGLWDRPDRHEWFGGGYDHAGIHSICVDPRDPQQLRVAISSGGVWCSSDGGAQWRSASQGLRAAYMPPARAGDPNAQDPHRMVQCRAQPDVLWIQHHNGIFRSTDGAQQWAEIVDIEPSTFGFAVAVHPQDPDTAWFVPATKDECRVPVDGRMVVTRTRDGGRSFTSLHAGLPPAPAYDLVYRHGLDVDDSGDCLALGSTTGGLWVSTDQGEHWRQVSAHLPPIYAVRFARAGR